MVRFLAGVGYITRPVGASACANKPGMCISKDKLGYRVCYNDGVHVPCPEEQGGTKQKAPTYEEAKDKLWKQIGSNLDEKKATEIFDYLRGMELADLEKLRDEFNAKGKNKEEIASGLKEKLEEHGPEAWEREGINVQQIPETLDEEERHELKPPKVSPSPIEVANNEAERASEREGSERSTEQPTEAGGPVEEAAGESDATGTSEGGENVDQSVSEGTPKHIPASVEAVNQRLNRYEQLFRSRGNHKVADWMGMLRGHINHVGVDMALESLGQEVTGEDEAVQYGGHNLEGNHDAQFIESYLNRAGISLIEGSIPEGDERAISTVSASSDAEGLHERNEERDFFPKLQTLRDKLHESQHLPGLEKSEDLSKLMGGEFGADVPQFTPEIIKKLDETYGEGKWIVKSYSDDAYAGFGIFFPQRVQQLQQDARNTMWSSGAELAKYGFKHLRDESGKVIGIQYVNGDEYKFGTEKYNNTIGGDVRHWADKAAEAALSEQGTALPKGREGNPVRYMAQPAFPVVGISNEERAKGVTFKRGQEGRVHVVTRNGKAELVPHSTWLKEEPLPVVFEDDDTRAMAQAAVDAINALPESERNGQLYAPDIVKTADGYKVVEANPANEAGASGYLQDNPLIVDAYVSQITGREPAHVKFIRKLLSKREKKNKSYASPRIKSSPFEH